jgi:oxygen-independent coproporphyrinogen-3 oxidase
VKAFEMADEVGFDSINTDLIVGLTGETKEDFEHTLSSIIALQPNNITVHTLALKRGSVFAGNGEITQVSESEVAECVRFARERLAQYGYEPYYLYRQKYMTGSLENVGYSKGGTQCIYNVDIMEEVANIIACGAGAISKRVFNSENRIERSANVKNIDHYIQRTNEMMERKKELFD